MKLTVELALQMLENFRGTTESDKWIEHCICVAGGVPDPNENLFLTDFIKNHEYNKRNI